MHQEAFLKGKEENLRYFYYYYKIGGKKKERTKS